MKTARRAYELDLTKLRDEELVVLAKECGYHAAETELLLRHRDWSQRLITQLARRRGLAPTDAEDAQQDSVFGVLKAISRYDTFQLARPQGCTFHAFLRRVVTDRFKDFVKQLWRYKGRYGRSMYSAFAAEGEEQCCNDNRSRSPEGSDDPALAAEWQETMGRFQEFVQRLDDTGRGLVDGLVSGVRLRVIAAHLSISYDSAKRRRRKLQSELASCLGKVAV